MPGRLPVIQWPLETGGTQGATALDLWVNDSTYLPVQSVATGPVGGSDAGKTWTTVNQYTFLSPTQPNLATLQVTIPPGFSETVSASDG